jgi:hypothetical protein
MLETGEGGFSVQYISTHSTSNTICTYRRHSCYELSPCVWRWLWWCHINFQTEALDLALSLASGIVQYTTRELFIPRACQLIFEA